ncbi:hypothetical protein ACQ4N7_13900 [Nodosilinea sp. AN01ver1]|uniref:hypothetical protein n=1 Tax=Nodosilinea sp. AN01ver1 TaxID=3423362 RepID=UPI003D31FDDE
MTVTVPHPNENRYSSSFFSFGSSKGKTDSPNWIELRDRWEYSHVARAGLGCLSLVALVIAIA